MSFEQVMISSWSSALPEAFTSLPKRSASTLERPAGDALTAGVSLDRLGVFVEQSLTRSTPVSWTLKSLPPDHR